MPSYRQRKGQQTPPERPDRVTPVPDTVEGVFYPYRGNENHGVAQPPTVDPDKYYEADQWDDGDIPETLKPEPEPEPIPVKIVQETARERLDWRPVRFLVTETKQQVVGRHEKRRSIVIRNLATADTVYLGADESVSTYTGFALEQGKELELRTTEDIWAVCAATETAEISIAYEYAIEL